MPQKKNHHGVKKIEHTSLSSEVQAQVQQVLMSCHDIAHELHRSTDEAQIEKALLPIASLAEDAQLLLIKALSKEQAIDVADTLSAVYTYSPLKEVRKEARRSLIHLEGAKIYPQWEPLARPKLSNLLDENLGTLTSPPRFWKGLATASKGIGEVQLMLYWEQGVNYKDVRVMGFLLEFLHDGVKDFFTNIQSKNQAMKQVEWLRQQMEVKLIDCTFAQGKQLLEEALATNKQANTRPHSDYVHNLPLIRQLILDREKTESEETMTEMPFSNELPFISPDLQDLLEGTEAEDITATFIDEWTKGNYGEVYDLLASESPLREGLERDEWIARREQWSALAHPAQARVSFVQERESEGEDLNTDDEEEVQGPYVVEVGWSLEHRNTSQALPELPQATSVYTDSGRRWFWSSYTLIEEEDELFIQDMTDEGALAQQLSQEELNQRMTEIAELVTMRALAFEEEEDEEAVEEEDADENEEDEEDIEEEEFAELVDRVQEAMRLTTVAMHYSDALITQTPNDPSLYEVAYDQAGAIQEYERAAAYMQQMAEHCPDQRGEALRRQAIALLSVSETHSASNDEEQATRTLVQAEQLLRESLVLDPAPFGKIMLAQALIAQEKSLEEAEDLLQQALSSSLEPRDETLASASLGRIAHEHGQNEQALQHYQHAATLSPDFPGIWLNLAQLQRELKQLDEAEQSYLRAIEAEPEQTNTYVELAYMYAELQNDLAKAQSVLEEGIETNPDSAELLAAMAMVNIQGGDLRSAKEYLEEAEDIDPDLEFVQQVRSIYQAQRTQQIQSSKQKPKHNHKRKK